MICSGIFANEFTFPFILKACALQKAYLEGVSVHLHAVKLGFSESHICVQNGLINFYVGCGKIDCAGKVFDFMEFRTLVSWNSMITGYAKMGWWREAFLLFVDVFLHNALLDMYAKCGHLQMAEGVFKRMVEKNVVSWTSMLSAYAKHGFVELAERTFNQMPVKNNFYRMCHSCMIPDETYVSLSACSQLGDLVTGKKMHDYLRDNSVQPTVTLCNSLIDMYAKCGSAEKALDVFLKMPEKNIVSWNTVMNALALHGYGYRAIELFQEMEAGGIWPDAVTFSALLSACCHCGLVEIGRYFFSKMAHMYNIPYDVEHYACMIDILGRGGLLKEALELVGKMEMKPDIVIWGTLLGACRTHRNVSIAKLVLKQLLELEPNAGGLYVLMSNIFCEAQQWDEMKKMRKLMKDHGVRKSDAVSSIEVSGHISDFMVDDNKHEYSNLIYLTLNQMKDHLKSEDDVYGLRCEFLDAAEI
ncbi:UNVERIFIED_CONTAM: Pentatricopeptide repeat-containing protein [Sesamum radiatum]|uniref:Pentatricopeptide repeat-containing protein n=1 Tax=Sesamum radiatum TaxID=300843 RepID=A0AAW2V5U4_SESRA